jgi:hypothetical protein
MVLAVLQSGLIAASKVRLHRGLGIAGAVLAALMVPVGALAQLAQTHRVVASGLYLRDPVSANFVLIGALLVILVVFPALVVTGIYFRRRPQAHRRLMTLATVSLLPPALVRLTSLAALGPATPLVAFALQDLFIAALLVYDFQTRKKLHPASIWGGALIALFQAALLSPLLRSAAGADLAPWIASLEISALFP